MGFAALLYLALHHFYWKPSGLWATVGPYIDKSDAKVSLVASFSFLYISSKSKKFRFATLILMPILRFATHKWRRWLFILILPYIDMQETLETRAALVPR